VVPINPLATMATLLSGFLNTPGRLGSGFLAFHHLRRMLDQNALPMIDLPAFGRPRLFLEFNGFLYLNFLGSVPKFC
jgi:hypothetical protein